MATARKITDFMASGTHAARPATPPGLGAGEIAFYYETDTLHLFAYVSGAWTQIDSPSAAPTIVQNASITLAAHSTGIVLGAAPIAGNLLVALVSDISTSPTAGAGWTQIASASAAQDGYGVLWKLAGAGESTTQVPASDAHAGTVTVFELNNAAPGIFTVAPGYTGTAVAESPVSSKSNGNGLILGVFVNRTTVGPTSLTGTGVVADSTATGNGRAVAAFHINTPNNGANVVTANYATSQGGLFIAIGVG